MLHIFQLRMNKTYLEKEICDFQIWLYYVNWQVFLQKHPISILVLWKEKKQPKNEWPWHHLSLPFTMGSKFENNSILIFSWNTFHTFNLHQGKGQIISKGLLLSSNFPKKRTNKFVFTTMTNSFVRFLGEFEETKSPFEIIWPLTHLLQL